MTLQEYFADKPRGSKMALAKAVGISKTWMAQIINKRVLCSPELAYKIELHTRRKVKRKDLRPDLFGKVA